MSDRVKSNSMQDVFHAAGNSANINFGKYAPKDKVNPLGAREMSDVIKALVDSNYNTGKYYVDYTDEEKMTARNNINSASNSIVLSKQFTEKPAYVEPINGNIYGINGYVNSTRSGSGEASDVNVRAIANKKVLAITLFRGKNICGGYALYKRFKMYLPSATFNDAEKSVSFSSSDEINTGGIVLMPQGAYKQNTRYTFVITGMKETVPSSSTPLRIYYTDGSSTNISFNASSTAKQHVVVTSSANKTVSSIGKTSASGTTKVYCNECGVFEGVFDSYSKYEAFDGEEFIHDLINTDYTFCPGGYFDLEESVFKPYKYYATYDGETLVGPWLSSMDEYAEGTTPTTGAAVVDLGSFDADIDLTNYFPATTNNCSITIDYCSAFNVVFDAETNLIVKEIFDAIKELRADIASLDARVTALENPPETSNSISPSNSPLNLDTEITRQDVEISSLEIEHAEPDPNEPSESTDNI